MEPERPARAWDVECSRRTLLKLGAAGAGLWVLEERPRLLHRREPWFRPELAGAGVSPSHTVAVHRRDDMLDLTFDCYGLALVVDGNGARLARTAPDAAIVVGFPAQAIGEEAIPEKDKAGPLPDPLPYPPPLQAFLAARSRVAFTIPAAVTSIPYTVEALLGWTAWSLRCPAAATPPVPEPASSPLVEPGPDETAIEAPWRLVLAPDPALTFAHARGPVAHTGRTELWHTRLAVRGPGGGPDERAETPPTARAVWTPDLVTPSDPLPNAATRSSHRVGIARQTADYGLSGVQTPLTVRRLMLSPLGAWTDLDGRWDDRSTEGVDVVAFQNRATQGRDHFVRVDTAGFLFPFGHRASLITISERKLERVNGTGARGAYLRQRRFVVVRQPTVAYPAPGQPNEGRAFPFQAVELRTLVTPLLDPYTPDPNLSDQWGSDPVAQRLKVADEDFPWSVVGTDDEGRRITWTMPLLFVYGTAAVSGRDQMKNLCKYYLGPPTETPTDPRSPVAFGGQKLAYAPVGNGKAGSTSYDTDAFVFGGESRDTPVPPQPAGGSFPLFFPTFVSARVQLATAAALSGQTDAATSIIPHPGYVAAGLDPAKGSVFADLATPLDLLFSGASDRSGGVAAPDTSITGLSRDFGVLGGGDNTVDNNGDFNPGAYFAGANPKLLGDISLSDIVAPTPFHPVPSTGPALPDPQVPGLTTEIVYQKDASGQPDLTKPPAAIHIIYDWRPALQPAPPTASLFVPEAGAALDLHAELLRPVAQPGPPTSDVSGELRSFTLHLIGKDTPTEFLVVHFDRLAFRSHNGAKPDVDVRISAVTFGGALKFVNPLEALLASLGVGPTISVTPEGVSAGYTLPLPNVGIGVLSLQNLALSASVTIPFVDAPMRARFAFCSREHPFLLSVALFGGGGFFAIGVGVSGIELVEAALEFGGNFSFDIGIASGGIHLLAGIYFKYTDVPTKSLTLTGYVRLGGELSVAGGVVSVSIELYIALSYAEENGHSKAVGEATLTISVHVAFFGIDASVSVRKEFGGGGDPTFAQLVGPDDWEDYCEAFAPR